jgi:NADH-quinone oxidoreductase subunit G
MITIEIDGKTCQAESGQMLIDVADAAGIEIPRFCYHKKLSVAASCRMCLVDVEKAPKPLPACATPVMNGMVVRTRSDKARTAQKAVMEFLLINHPLDCPICDQGGECELQDIAVGYGNDLSRFQELKRVVPDKYLGPLISTEMTRCIHCTRCVRFSAEIAGVREMGATGRGENMRIGTYIENTIDSELSGNMVDVCPVGALTSKPFRFTARAWELQQRDSISPHDAVGANLHFHIRRNQVMRAVPKENEAVNEVWLADRDRYSYLALQAEDRLTSPMIKKDGQWQTVEWETALKFAVKSLHDVSCQHTSAQLGVLASSTATLEELYLLQKLMRGMNCSNIDYRVRQNDFRDQEVAPIFPYLGQSLSDLEKLDTALIIGSNLRKEQPLINQRLRKATLADRGLISERVKANMMAINPADYEFNYPLKVNAIDPSLIKTLASVAKALGADIQAESCENAQLIADTLKNGQNKTILVGQFVQNHSQASVLRSLISEIGKLSGSKIGYLAESGNAAGAGLMGVLPHRGVAGKAIENKGLSAQQMLTKGLKGYLLLGLEPELDSRYGATALETLKKAQCVVSLTAFKTPAMLEYATVLLPIALFPETSGTYINGEGRWQAFNGAVPPAGEARPAWKVLRVLANLLQVDGFEYASTEDIRHEISALLPETPVADNFQSNQLPSSFEIPASNELQRITEMPIYAVDAMVRRAAALQNTNDAKKSTGIVLNAQQFAHLQGRDQITVSQNGQTFELTFRLDEHLPQHYALMFGGQMLGNWDGFLTVGES